MGKRCPRCFGIGDPESPCPLCGKVYRFTANRRNLSNDDSEKWRWISGSNAESPKPPRSKGKLGRVEPQGIGEILDAAQRLLEGGNE